MAEEGIRMTTSERSDFKFLLHRFDKQSREIGDWQFEIQKMEASLSIFMEMVEKLQERVKTLEKALVKNEVLNVPIGGPLLTKIPTEWWTPGD